MNGNGALLLGKLPGQANLRNEVIGGLVSTGVAIPLAIGYGMFAFVALGNHYFLDGALAGLITAAIVGIACVALGDKSSHIYAPRITTTFFIGVLLYELVHSDAAAIRTGGVLFIIATIFTIVLLAGFFQFLFGLARLGSIIKLTPQPVMAGFQNAAALLLFLVQLGNVFGFDKATSFVQALRDASEARPLSVVIAVVVIVVTWNSRKFLPRVPPLLVGLLVGTVLYYAIGLVGFGSSLGPTIGSVPFTEFRLPNVPRFGDVWRTAGVAQLVPLILGGALALAIVGSIDALLCTKILSRPGEPKVNGDQLLMRLGIGNVLAAGWGGITGGLNIGPSLENKNFGGRAPLSALVNAMVMLVTLVALFPILSYIPCVALSAVIMVIAVQHVDSWTVGLVRRAVARGAGMQRRRILIDLFVVLLVAILSVTVDIVLAVFLGVAIAALLFMWRMSRSVIRRSYRCSAVRSRKLRPAAELEVLGRTGSAVLVMELQGALFFGSAEKLAADIAAQAGPETRYVILDLRRITEIDSTGQQTLKEIQAELAAQSKALLLCLADAGATDAVKKERVFPDLDRAIQSAEDELLRAEAKSGEAAEIPLAQAAMLVDFSTSELAALEKHMKRVVHKPGHVMFREGEAGKELFIIVKGTASAFLPQEKGADIRLVTFATGTVFGELAILDSGVRSATVIADSELACYVLKEKDFAAMSANQPELAIKLLAGLARQLSHRLRAANRTIEQLED